MAIPIRTAVTNTSPIIALASIGEIRLLGQLFETVIMPFGVWTELTEKPNANEPGQVRSLLPKTVFLPAPPPPPIAGHLHKGEQEAIALALAMPGSWVLLDDGDARQIATALGLFVKGTLGILIEAKRRGLVAHVRPLLEELVRRGNYLSADLIAQVLASVGE